LYPADVGSLKELLAGGKLNSTGPGNPSNQVTVRADNNNKAVAFGWILNGYEDWVFAPETALYTVRDHFKVASLDGFGLKDRTAATGAAGARLPFLTHNLRRGVRALTPHFSYH